MGDVAQAEGHGDEVEAVIREGQRFDVGDDIKRLGQQDITGQHGRGLAKCLVAGGLAPAQVVVVHAGQVVVDQRIAVQHLHGGGKLVGSGGITVQHIADVSAVSAFRLVIIDCIDMPFAYEMARSLGMIAVENLLRDMTAQLQVTRI